MTARAPAPVAPAAAAAQNRSHGRAQVPAARPPLMPLQAPARDDPALWLGPTPLVDLDDPRLRLKAQSLTQLSRTDRDKALAIYRAVKRLPFAKPVKLRLRTAHELLRARHADAEDKATLFVALLRAIGVPARLCYVELHGDILRGLTRAIASAGRPVVQAWIDGAWRSTDTYIFDAHYAAAARARLRSLNWEWGYGLHRRGHSLWNGADDAFLTGDEHMAREISLGVLGWFHDPQDFLDSPVRRERFTRVPRAFRWNMLAPTMNRAVDRLRLTQPGGRGAQ